MHTKLIGHASALLFPAVQIRICRRGGALVRRALVRAGSHLCDAPGFHFVRAVNSHLLWYTCQATVDILLEKVFPQTLFLNPLLLFRDKLSQTPFAEKAFKGLGRGSVGIKMLRIFAFIQKGFPQLLDTHTAANTDLS